MDIARCALARRRRLQDRGLDHFNCGTTADEARGRVQHETPPVDRPQKTGRASHELRRVTLSITPDSGHRCRTGVPPHASESSWRTNQKDRPATGNFGAEMG